MKRDSNPGKEMKSHYDFEGGVRGKFANRYAKGTNVVVLDPDVAKIFGSAKVVNRVLRRLAKSLAVKKPALSSR